eukprot:g20931.t1
MWDMYKRKKDEWLSRPNPTEPLREEDGSARGINYKSLAIKMGLVALGTVFVATGTLPLTTAGGAVWEAIKQLDNKFSASEPTKDLEERYEQNMKVLGHILRLLDERVKAAKIAAQSGDPELCQKEEDENSRVETLRIILDHATKGMVSVQNSTDASVDKKKQHMESMLKELHGHREGLLVAAALDKLAEAGVTMQEVSCVVGRRYEDKA